MSSTAILTPRRKEMFLEAFRCTGNISQSAKESGLPRSTVYLWLREDEEFTAAFEDAKEQAADALEQEARRRAVEGTIKPVFHKGKKVGGVREYSDTLLIFMLKGARPEKYRERWEGKLDGNLDLNINLAERLARALEE